MKTRSDYMAHAVSHNDYYNQFVNDNIVKAVAEIIGIKRIKASDDVYFNDIDLIEWDNLRPVVEANVDRALIKAAGEQRSLSTAVCIAKAAARRLI